MKNFFKKIKCKFFVCCRVTFNDNLEDEKQYIENNIYDNNKYKIRITNV